MSLRQLHPCSGAGYLEEVLPGCLGELLANTSSSVISQLTRDEHLQIEDTSELGSCSLQPHFGLSVCGGRFFLGVRFQPAAPVSAAHAFQHLSASEIKDRRPTMQRKSDGPLHAGGCSGPRAPARRRGKEGSSISLPRCQRGRSLSAQGEGGREATNLPGNVSLDLHLLGSERRTGKSGEESSSCGGGERCGEPGAAGSRPPLAP